MAPGDSRPVLRERVLAIRQGQAPILSLLDPCRDPRVTGPLGLGTSWSVLSSHECSPFPPALAPPVP